MYTRGFLAQSDDPIALSSTLYLCPPCVCVTSNIFTSLSYYTVPQAFAWFSDLMVEHAEIFWSLFAEDMDKVLAEQPRDTWDSFPLFKILNDYLREDGTRFFCYFSVFYLSIFSGYLQKMCLVTNFNGILLNLNFVKINDVILPLQINLSFLLFLFILIIVIHHRRISNHRGKRPEVRLISFISVRR